MLLCGAAVLSMASCAGNSDATTVEAATVARDTTPPAPDAAQATKGYAIGDAAADFSLKNVDGKMVALADYKDAKGFIVIFTCNHCPYAKACEQRIIDLNKRYADKGYPVIAISPNDPAIEPKDSYEEMQKLAKAKGYTFPYLIDEGQTVYPAFGANKTPHVFILQKENNQNIVKYIGAIDDNYEHADQVKHRYAEAAVDALLAGKPVETTKTVAIGCGIKDKKTAS
ncbi:Thiol-disulfide oxidoreductase ResA [compost metagenome]